MSPPKGVVAIFIDDEGRVIATTSDFNTSGFGGFDLYESQKHRAGQALADAVIEAYASDRLTRAIRSVVRNELMMRLVQHHNCKVTYIPINHDE